jgi:hypothetical protein
MFQVQQLNRETRKWTSVPGGLNTDRAVADAQAKTLSAKYRNVKYRVKKVA